MDIGGDEPEEHLKQETGRRTLGARAWVDSGSTLRELLLPPLFSIFWLPRNLTGTSLGLLSA